jgi:uncharacterized protein
MMTAPTLRQRSMKWLAVALMLWAAASVLTVSARAQFFEDRYPGSDQRYRRPPQSRDFFFPFFNPGDRGPQSNPFIRPPQPVESTKAPPPRKQETPPTSTVLVIGDSLADWLAYGLEETYAADSPDVGVVRNIHAASGLVRYDPHNDTEWSQAVKDALASEKPSAIVVMLGLNDRLPLRDRAPPRPGQQTGQPTGAQPSPQGQGPAPAASSPETARHEVERAPAAAQGPSYEFHTDKWEELYSKRIDDMIAALKSKGVPVLWVGLPSVRGARSTSDMSYLDDLYRARAEKAGIIYVDIWDGFVDERGNYAVQGPDFEGQTRRLRTYDGVHFTKYGALKLAHYVEHELSRVLLNRVTPVALPAPEETPGQAGPGPRPVTGPVLPLTAATNTDGKDLVGAGGHPAPPPPDPIATRVLSRGDALAAPSGRADDFAWPRSSTEATSTPEVAPEIVNPPPVAPATGPATHTDSKTDLKTDSKTFAKKVDDPKTKNKAALDPASGRPRPPAPFSPAPVNAR